MLKRTAGVAVLSARTVAPAWTSRSPTFTPPFCVSATKVRCE
ncbi:MAG TPA: hypothetical protein VHT52_24865 [Stellaceae bacterium]|nr:hypothetical protein [Stellaceae bacterium]